RGSGMRHALLRRCGATLTLIVSTLALAAPASAASTGVDGTVVDLLSGAPVSANVVLSGIDITYFNQQGTDATGHYAFPDAPAGDYLVEVFATNYVSYSDEITAPGTDNITLTPVVFGNVAGHVRDADGSPVANVYVELDTTQGGYVDSTGTD